MHPPRFRIDQRLLDWPEWPLELRSPARRGWGRVIGEASLSRRQVKLLVQNSARWQNVVMPSSPQRPERISKAHALHLAASVELIRLWRERAACAEAELEAFQTAACNIIQGRRDRDLAKQRAGWRQLRRLIEPDV